MLLQPKIVKDEEKYCTDNVYLFFCVYVFVCFKTCYLFFSKIQAV